MTSGYRKHTGEKRLGELFEPFPKPKSADNDPAADEAMDGTPIAEPVVDNPSVPLELSDPAWQGQVSFRSHGSPSALRAVAS
jgi:hypothetical protein